MPRSLAEYQRKRDFSKTPEPKGSPEPQGQNRFVVQKHWATRLHYDFRLEMDGVLVSWAIPKGPTLNPAEKRLAAHVEDHPVSYYDFEGTIPKGEYGGGTVMIWDWGTFELEESTPAESLKRGEVKFRLKGVRLCGRYALVRTRSEKDWLLIKKKDECADPNFNIETLTTSVKTGRTKEEIEQGKDAVWSSRREEGQGGLINLANAEKGPMPKSLDPMKAQLLERPFDDDRWLFEVKWDGIRLVSFIDDGKVTLQTRAGRVVDAEYPQLEAISRLVNARQAVVDGEVVVLDEEGRPSFQLLQNRGKDDHPMQYVVFDIVYVDGQRLFKVPLEDRKRLLRDIVRDSGVLKYSDHVLGQGTAFFKAAQQKQLEGIVAKLRDSPYQPGVRSSAWQKIKARLQQEVVIGGFTEPRASRKYFGALLVGVYEEGKLVYTGHIGGGFDEKTLAQLYKLMKPLIVKQPPFSGTPPRGNEKPTWVKPVLIAEVRFAEWTRDGVMRQPVFLGLRDDIDPREVRRELPQAKPTTPAARPRARTSTTRRKAPPTVALKAVRAPARPSARTTTAPATTKRASSAAATADTPLSRAAARIAKQLKTDIRGATTAELEALDAIAKEGNWEIGGRTVHLTNLDKLLFPEDRYTKRDLIRYYVQVAPVMIPHYKDRPLSMNPHPDGIHGKSYWVKDKPGYAPEWIPTFRYQDQKSLKDWILIEEVATLAWLANHAVIDMHPWYSRVDKPEYPDWSVVDLDPAEGATFKDVVAVAKVVKTALDHLKLSALLKTTGQSGLHIYIPIERRYTLDESRGFVATLAHMIAELMPDKVTEVWEVKRRTGKIRIDYTQNVMNKTLAGPYSVRPALRAPVSTPLAWKELDDPRLRADKWTIQTLGDRLLEVGDLFHDALTLRQRLPSI
ncbi:MAG TPA: DNA ligase D [Candidatus Dormibacteraeota bacterium]|nr:DNA ligase D [Candidatus Dormibacteraeota bacterium]